jgi:hypothetical protein
MGTWVKRPSPAMVVAIIALIAALTGTAFAALGKNSVGSKQLKKNAVTAAKIKKNAVTAAKIKTNAISEAKLTDNAVTSDKLKDNAVTNGKIAAGAVTGAKVNLATLGTVPSATNATNAANLAGQQNFFIQLNPGQSQTVATNGSVALVAQCDTGVEGTSDRVRILAQTSLSGAILNGVDDLSGPGGSGKFLEPGTPADERELLTFQDTTGEIDVSARIDQGFVLGPDGKMITLHSSGVALGLNYGGTTCLTAGVLNLIG